MKKLAIIFLTVLSLVSLSAVAKTHTPGPRACPFQDNFYLNEGIIKSLSATGGIFANQVNPQYFITGCQGGSYDDGTATLTVLSLSGNTCTLKILDGATEFDPTVTSWSCTGTMQYTGMEHPFNTYNYTLDFLN